MEVSQFSQDLCISGSLTMFIQPDKRSVVSSVQSGSEVSDLINLGDAYDVEDLGECIQSDDRTLDVPYSEEEVRSASRLSAQTDNKRRYRTSGHFGRSV